MKWFSGVYISKTSYIRQGEKSLDGFYRAWHHVEYYRWMFDRSGFHWEFRSHSWLCDHRYLRFFPDGQVIMLTTPEDPQAIVPRLRTKNTRYACSVFIKMYISNYMWVRWSRRSLSCKFHVRFHLNSEFKERFSCSWNMGVHTRLLWFQIYTTNWF